MAQNTIRLHLNSNDAILQTVDGVKNHANATFDLSRAGIHAVADQMLSIALVKAVIPTQTTSIGYDNNNPAFEVGTTKIYITSQELVFPDPSAPTIAKLPVTYIQGPADLLNQLNLIISITTPGMGQLVTDEINGSLKLLGPGPVVIQNKYFQKDQPEYSLIGEKLAQIMGINTETTLPTTVFGASPLNLTTQYSVALALPPLKLATNLGLDSVVSKGSLNSILSNIPITIANQSQKLDILPEVVPPDPPLITDIAQKVNLDGSDDHINIPMDSNNPVLNWDQSWSIGFTAEQIHDAASGVGVKRTIATRGTNGIYLIIGTGNVGFYASATDGFYDPANNQGMTHAHGANTWYPSPANVKWLFTYNSTTGKLRWFVGEISGLPAYVQRGVITMTTTERTINQSSEDLNIGDAMDGHYGSTYFDGHLDDLLITNNEMTGQQVVDYFTDDDFQSHEYSEHIVSHYNFNQAFPNVDDQVGSYNGTHEGSSNPDNFIAN